MTARKQNIGIDGAANDNGPKRTKAEKQADYRELCNGQGSGSYAARLGHDAVAALLIRSGHLHPRDRFNRAIINVKWEAWAQQKVHGTYADNEGQIALAPRRVDRAAFISAIRRSGLVPVDWRISDGVIQDAYDRMVEIIIKEPEIFRGRNRG